MPLLKLPGIEVADGIPFLPFGVDSGIPLEYQRLVADLHDKLTSVLAAVEYFGRTDGFRRLGGRLGDNLRFVLWPKSRQHLVAESGDTSEEHNESDGKVAARNAHA